jgi:predicted AAA+ superfamily ATPase
MQNPRSLGLTGTEKYLDYMEGAYLIRRLAPWHQNNGKRLVKSLNYMCGRKSFTIIYYK